jgi:Uma2 family endonuclease
MSASTTPSEAPWLIPPALRLQLLALLASEPQNALTMTYDEFLDWADEDTQAEWVNGKVVMASPVSVRHQLVVNFLVGVLDTYARLHNLGRVLNGPFQMKLATSGREPDVLFLAKDHLDKLCPTFLDGPADLAVEVISPESAGRVRGDKFFEYQQGGVREYWLLDGERQRAEFYQLDAQGSYQIIVPAADGLYRSAVLPGLWLKVAWLWQEPLPSVEHVLLTIDRAAYESYLEQLRTQGELP